MASKEVRIVWDVTIGDEAVFEDRMGLIRHAADVIRKKGKIPRFVVVLHGPATKFIARFLEGTKFENQAQPRLRAIQQIITEMNGKDEMRFVQCQIPMTRNNVAPDNVLPFVDVSETVFYDLAVLQREGYAYIPISDIIPTGTAVASSAKECRQ